MAYDVAKAFKRIEDELIDSMMRNLGRHNAEEALEGFDWTQWQVEQLRSLEEYRKNNQEKYGPEFKKINERIGKSIEQMGAKGENEQEKEILRAIDKGHVPPIKREGNLEGTFFGVNNRKLDALLDATQNDFQRAEIAVLRRADDQYRRIIFDAQVYANTGAATYGKAIDMATKDFLMRGIDCIEYKNGARHTISDYADMYVKTAQTRAYLAGEGKMRGEWGEHYVVVNKRGDVTCPKCAKWVGRVLIDDVYSGGKPDGKTPLLSTAMADGFLHPRCKDIFTTYFPGISTPPEPATKKEIWQAERAEKAEVRQSTAELMQEKWERRAKYQMDPADKRMCVAHLSEWKEAKALAKTANGITSLPEDMLTILDRGPVPGKLISEEELMAFVKEVEDRGFRFVGKIPGEKKRRYGGFETFRGSPSDLYMILDELDKTRSYWTSEMKKKGLLIGYADLNEESTFAKTNRRNIYFNKQLFDSHDYLEAAYLDGVINKEFVEGTTYRAIPWHEIGHTIQATDSYIYNRLIKVINRLAQNDGLSFEEELLSVTSKYGIFNMTNEYQEALCELLSALTSSDVKKRQMADEIIKEVMIR